MTVSIDLCLFRFKCLKNTLLLAKNAGYHKKCGYCLNGSNIAASEDFEDV